MEKTVTKPVRILHVLTAMNLAGTESLLMNLYRNIDRTRVQFDFAVSAEERCAYDVEIEELGGKIFHYPRYAGINHFVYRKWWNDFFKAHTEYRIIHGHIGSTAALYLSIAKKHGCYTIAHSHSTAASVSIHSILYKAFSYPTRNIADFFFGCSQQAIIDRYGNKVAGDPNKAKVLNNAIDARLYVFDKTIRDEVRREYNTNDNRLVIGTVGRLTPQKNPFEIINICQELNNREIEFDFWLFGEGELRAEIEEIIISKGLSNQVKLLGTRSDIYRVLQGMDIFLFPSIWEGLGIACVEAQAAGLPTFCSNTVPAEAKATELCCFLQLNNTHQWCDEVIKTAEIISENKYERKNMYKQIERSGFDISEVASDLEQFYLTRIASD